MDLRELKELISKGESTRLEFKRKISSPQKIAKEFAAFANTLGGILLLGVDDDGKIVGVESEKSALEELSHIAEFYVFPPVGVDIEIVDCKRKEVLLVEVKESSSKPHKVETINEAGKPVKTAYIRTGDKAMPAGPEMTKLLSSQNADSKPITLSIGENEKRFFLFLEKYERGTVKDFSKLVNISDRRAGRLLVRLVRAGALQIHNENGSDYYTLADI